MKLTAASRDGGMWHGQAAALYRELYRFLLEERLVPPGNLRDPQRSGYLALFTRRIKCRLERLQKGVRLHPQHPFLFAIPRRRAEQRDLDGWLILLEGWQLL